MNEEPESAVAHGYLPEIAVAIVVVVWGSIYTITKNAYQEVAPLAFTAARFTGVIALAWAVVLLRGWRDPHRWIAVPRADLLRLAGLGMAGYFLYQLGFTLGLAHTSPFSASLMIAMIPLVSLLIVRVLGERQPLIVWAGLAVSIIGVAIFLLSGDKDSKLLGNVIAFGGACAFAFYQVLGRPLVLRYPPETFAAWTTLFGAVPLIIVGLPDVVRQDWAAVSPQSWLVIAYMSVFPVYIAYMLWGWAISQRGMTITVWNLMVPILSGIISAAVTGEMFGTLKVLGAALALGGLVCMRLPSLLGTRRGTVA